MPELLYIRVVSEQCKDDQHLDCPGKFQDGTYDGRAVWRKCECDCSHPLKWRRNGNSNQAQSSPDIQKAGEADPLRVSELHRGASGVLAGDELMDVRETHQPGSERGR